MADRYDEGPPGEALVNLLFAGTGALVGTSLAGALLPDTFDVVHAALSLVLFAIGTGAMLWGYALGVSRSRTVAVTMAGLFFLAGGSAPAQLARRFRLALVVEVVVVVAAALARPDSNMPFGVLAPMFALGLMAVWGGRYGVFPARQDAARRDAAPDGETS